MNKQEIIETIQSMRTLHYADMVDFEKQIETLTKRYNVAKDKYESMQELLDIIEGSEEEST